MHQDVIWHRVVTRGAFHTESVPNFFYGTKVHSDPLPFSGWSSMNIVNRTHPGLVLNLEDHGGSGANSRREFKELVVWAVQTGSSL